VSNQHTPREVTIRKPSLLERAARAIEPPRPAGVSSVARRIKPLSEIQSAEKVFLPGEKPRPTNGHIKHLDGTGKIFYTDGSLRLAGGKINGKDARKARARLKKQRHAV
jgi:hypothetical protein